MTRSVVEDLNEKNIGIEDEEFYAVMAAYVIKINELEGKKLEFPTSLLKSASSARINDDEQSKKTLETQLKSFLKGQDKALKTLCESNMPSKEKIEALHEMAVLQGFKRGYLETVSRCNQFASVNDLLERKKSAYRDSYLNYITLSQLKYDEKALEHMIKKRAGKVQTPMDTLKNFVKKNMETEEDAFLSSQTNFIGRTVSFLVDGQCRIKAYETENSTPALAAEPIQEAL